MARETQISALISETTRELLEKHVRATGTKKGHLIEQAILEQIESSKPTPALRALLRDGD